MHRRAILASIGQRERKRSQAEAYALAPRVARRGSASGMTLIEAMVVVAILGILLATAVPSFAPVVARYRAATASADLMHAMMLTRSEAMRRGRRVYLAPIGGRWHAGWTIFVDHNDNRVFDAGGDELILRHDALAASTTVSNPANANREPFTDLGSPQRPYILFDGTGYARQRSGAFAAGSLTVTDRTGHAVASRTLCLAAYGRVREVQRSTC